MLFGVSLLLIQNYVEYVSLCFLLVKFLRLA